MNKSDQSFTYYDIGEFKNCLGNPINAVPVRRKIGKQITDPRIQGGKPFDQMLVEFWHNGQWIRLNRSNAHTLYGAKPRN